MDKMYDIGLENQDRVRSAFGGGFPARSLVVINGADGTGKSVLCQRFAYGMCEEGYSVGYVSPEFDSYSFVKQMDSLGYPAIHHMIVEKSLLFINADVNTQQRIPEENKRKRNLLKNMMRPSEIWNQDVIIIDGLDMIIRNDPLVEELSEKGDVDIGVQDFIDYISEITDNGSTVIITMNDSQIPSSVTTPFRNHSDILLDLETEKRSGEINHSINVTKYTRMSGDIDTVIGFEVQKDIGVSIKTQTIA